MTWLFFLVLYLYDIHPKFNYYYYNCKKQRNRILSPGVPRSVLLTTFPGLLLPWALLSLSSPTFYSFHSFFFFSKIFYPYLFFFFEVCFITSILYCIIFFQKTKYTLTSCVFRCCLTGLSLCLTHIFIFHNITTCQDRQSFSCLLLLLTHITLKWSKRKGRRQTTECFKMLAF